MGGVQGEILVPFLVLGGDLRCGIVLPLDGVPVVSAGFEPFRVEPDRGLSASMYTNAMNEVTRILHQIEQGEPHAAGAALTG